MDFDWVPYEYTELWNTQTAFRIRCLFSLHSKSIYPPLQQTVATRNVTRLIYECSLVRICWLHFVPSVMHKQIMERA